MNWGRLKKNIGVQVQLEPIARRFDDEGRELEELNDDWTIAQIGDDQVQLSNVRTGHQALLGKDQIHSFMTNPQRTRGDSRYGFLKLHVQISIRGRELTLRPTIRPGERLAPAQIPVHPSDSITVDRTVNTGVIAHTVNIRAPKARRPRINYPVGTVGSDAVRRNYIDYLVKRYFDFRKADASYSQKRPVSYPELHMSIERKFGAKTFFVLLNRFEELAEYLQDRIDNSIQGRNNRSKGWKSYESFSEYLKAQRADGKPAQ